MDKNGIIKDIQGMKYFFGVNKKELIGKKYYEIFPTSNDPYFEKFFRRSLEEGKIFGFEVYFENEGKENWFLITINPDSDGFSIHFKSINEIKKLEKQLKKTRENYKRILENSGEIIVECDQNFAIKYVNVPWFAGYQNEEVVGSTFQKFIDPEEWPDFKAMQKKRRKMVSTKFRYEQKILSKKGDDLWFKVSTTTLTDRNGEFKGIISILSDITHLKETELCLSDINIQEMFMDSPGVGIFLLDNEGRIKYTNTKMDEILGSKQPVGKYLDDFMNCSWSSKFNHLLENWEKGNQEVNELRFNKRDGKIVWAAVNTKVIYNARNKFLGVLGTATDITDQKNVEGSLIQREENLKTSIIEMTAVLNSFIKNHYQETREKKVMDN